MSHFQIYLPGCTDQNPQHLVDAGLGGLASGMDFMPEGVGPDGKGGSILAWRKPTDQRMGYKPQEQTWLPAVTCGDLISGRYWVGIWNDRPPTPADLLRPYAHKGTYVTLGDGKQWLIPEAEKLPADMIRADDGTWRFLVQRQYHDFYLESLRWRQWWAGSPTGFAYADVADFAELALGLNYRITTEVVSHLRLLTRDNVTLPMWAVLGLSDAGAGP